MNKRKALEGNYIALKEMFDGNKRFPKQWDIEKLKLYQGYGGLSEIRFNPDKPDQWTTSLKPLQEDVKKLQNLLLSGYNNNTIRYEKMMDALKNSVDTSFYTPETLVKSVIEPLKNCFSNTETIQVLDPCTGTGNFISHIKETFSNCEITGFEKDNTAGWLASKITGENIHQIPFEKISETLPDKKFDLVTSNIPFGDYSVYDPVFSKSKDKNLIDSQKKIHNYFFAKGMSVLKENGILAFITSTGVMDSPSNRFIRENLILNANLITAERLPNTAFKEAGTNVVSDVIILQKRENPLNNISEATEREKAFVNSISKEFEGNNHNINEFYLNYPKRVHGTLETGSFHAGRKIITVKGDDNYIETLRTNIESSINAYVLKKEIAPPSALKDYNIEIVPITDKAFILTGDTYKHKDFIQKDLHGVWQPKHKAWMFAEYKKEQITDRLLNHLNTANSIAQNTIPETTKTIPVQLDIFSQPPVAEVKPIIPKKETLIEKEENKQSKPDIVPPIKTEETVFKQKLSQEFIDNNCLQEGNLFYLNSAVYKLTKDENNEWDYEKTDISGKDLQRAKGIIEIRKEYQKLSLLESLNALNSNIENQRTVLNNVYDEFVDKFGILNSKTNLSKVILNDSFNEEIKALEWEEHGEYMKSDIFIKSMNIDRAQELKIENLQDAITYSLYKYGKVDINNISEVLNKDISEVISEGISKKLLAYNPIFPNAWNSLEAQKKPELYKTLNFEITTWDEFNSGKIYDKIQTFKHNDKFNLDNESKNFLISELENILPKHLSVKEINPNFGERWLDDRIYTEFVSNLLGGEYDIKYLQGLDTYNISFEKYPPPKYDRLYDVKCLNGRTLRTKDVISHALNDTIPEITYKSEDKTYTDTKAIANVESNINNIKQQFSQFIKFTPQFHNEIENKYFLSHLQNVKKELNVNPVIFNDVQNFAPRTHQYEAAWQIMSNNGGIVDHKVGAGKTLVIAMAAITMKRMGIANKPLVIGLKANTDSIYRDIKKAYPDAKVLFPTKKNTSPEYRKEFLYRMMNNDYDVIVMTHNQFETIPLPKETTLKVINDELKNLEIDLKVLNEDREANKLQIKGLIKRQENLEATLTRVVDEIKKDNLPSLDKIGIDHIFVDESHQFKNLEYTTRHNRVSGLSDPLGSKRAFNLYTSIRYLQEKNGGDKGATFLSGTTISNSITEMFLLLKYLRPNKLKELNMQTFDAWAKTFAEKSSEYEVSVTNEIKKRDRFRRFLKVPELSKLYNDIAHVITNVDNIIDQPKKNETLVKIPATEAQKQYSENLINFARTGNPSYIDKQFTDNQLLAKMLIATNEAKKMSIDMRLISENYSASDGSKLFSLCEKVNEYYQKYDHVKGTQLIFSDVGTPTTQGNLNLYSEIKKMLCDEYGIPEKQIAFVHDYNDTEKQIKEFEDKLNSGEIRIAIGSTQTMGTGKNIQERVCAGHHLDIPWTPKDYEQRNGRFERQGNWVAKEHCNNVVDVYCYATENSLDSYKFSLLSTKANFIEQIKNASLSVREIEEKAEDSITFGEFAAAINGKTELIDKIKKEKELQKFENLQATANEQISKAKFEINLAEKKIEKSKQGLGLISKDMQAFYKAFSGVTLPEEVFIIKTEDGKEFKGHKEIGQYIKDRVDEALKKNSYPDAVEVFRKDEFSIVVSAHQNLNGVLKNYMSVHSDITGNSYSNPYSSGELTTTVEPYSRLLFKSIDAMENRKKSYTKDITAAESSITNCNKRIKDGFVDYSGKIDMLKNEIEELDRVIEKGGKVKVGDKKESLGEGIKY